MSSQQRPLLTTPPDKTGHTPRVSITYHPALIPALVEEHKGAVKHLAQVLTSFERQDLSTTHQLLEQFKRETTAHVYKETTGLYLYLQYALVERPEEFAQMRKLRKGMDSIVGDTMAFLQKYETLETDPQKQNTFKAEMQALRDCWMTRIKIEETLLFPLYQPPV